MSEDEDDATQPPPSLVQRSVAATAVALVGGRLGLGGAIAGAAFAPYLEELARRAWDEFRPDSQRRQTEMLASAAKASARDPEELGDLVGNSERTRLLTITAMNAAARTSWPPKVSALGKALAAGLIAEDETQINVADLVLPAMADMERPHLSLLELLVRWEPVESMGHPLRVQPYQELPQERTWTARQIGEARQTLQPVLHTLICALEAHGLADRQDNIPSALAKYSEEMRRESERHGPRAGSRITTTSVLPPTMSEIDAQRLAPAPSWSPTELGERVLGFYQLAASESDPAQALVSDG